MYTHYPMNAQTPYMQQASIYGNPYQQRLEAITQQQAQQQSPQVQCAVRHGRRDRSCKEYGCYAWPDQMDDEQRRIHDVC